MTSLADRVSRALPGNAFPLGATPGPGGTNFAVASGTAEGMLLCLFDSAGSETRVPHEDVDSGVWHGFVPASGLDRPTAIAPPAPTTRRAGCVPTRPSY